MRYGQGSFWGDLIGANPTDRGKRGVKRSVLVEADGGPLSVVVEGANVHDARLLEATLNAVVVERPAPTEEEPQNLCWDKGYDNPTAEQAVSAHDYIPHMRRIGEEKLDEKGEKRYPARRWVVERTLGWLSKWRYCQKLWIGLSDHAASFSSLLPSTSSPLTNLAPALTSATS